jgi:Tfp pilus assembly protein PilO
MKSALSLVVVGICIGMYFVYISPAVSEVKSLSLKKASYDNVLLKSKEVVAKRDEIFVEYNNIPKDSIDKLNKIVPETFNSVLFANDINAMASSNGLAVKDFKVNPQRTEDRDTMTNQQAVNPYITTVVTFRLVGQYSQFIKFLTDIESSLRLLDVVNLSVKTLGGQKSTDDSLEYLLEINTYSLR